MAVVAKQVALREGDLAMVAKLVVLREGCLPAAAKQAALREGCLAMAAKQVILNQEGPSTASQRIWFALIKNSKAFPNTTSFFKPNIFILFTKLCTTF